MLVPVSALVGEAATMICKICGTNKPIENDEGRHRPETRRSLFTGGRQKFQQAAGWSSRVALRDGLSETVTVRRQSERDKLRRDRGICIRAASEQSRWLLGLAGIAVEGGNVATTPALGSNNWRETQDYHATAMSARDKFVTHC